MDELPDRHYEAPTASAPAGACESRAAASVDTARSATTPVVSPHSARAPRSGPCRDQPAPVPSRRPTLGSYRSAALCEPCGSRHRERWVRPNREAPAWPCRAGSRSIHQLTAREPPRPWARPPEKANRRPCPTTEVANRRAPAVLVIGGRLAGDTGPKAADDETRPSGHRPRGGPSDDLRLLWYLCTPITGQPYLWYSAYRRFPPGRCSPLRALGTPHGLREHPGDRWLSASQFVRHGSRLTPPGVVPRTRVGTVLPLDDRSLGHVPRSRGFHPKGPLRSSRVGGDEPVAPLRPRIGVSVWGQPLPEVDDDVVVRRFGADRGDRLPGGLPCHRRPHEMSRERMLTGAPCDGGLEGNIA